MHTYTHTSTAELICGWVCAVTGVVDAMLANGLADAGYLCAYRIVCTSWSTVAYMHACTRMCRYVLIDDGWPACEQYFSDGRCEVPAPRLANGSISVR